ncbi:hypothetical protein E8E13_004233 [Curvularia kusanoi]|uniref:Uncharacterized protein n=1 Tax=Curvularia kusanoi TaxID=90978 RepID=A0A9P4W902_CURKU|nr:hypothetical protein E8E13_004233 [Curvularia kusanoi]
MDNLDEKPAQALKKIIKNNRRKLRRLHRSRQQLQQQNRDMWQNRQDMIGEDTELRRANQELQQETQKLRKELQDIHHGQRQDQEATREYLKLQEEHQKLHSKHQDLQCEHNGTLQHLAGVQEATEKLKSKLKRAKLQYKEDTRTLDDESRHWRSRYAFLVHRIISPYAHMSKLKYDDTDLSSMDLVLKPLQKDILRGETSRKEFSTLKAQMQASQREAHSLQELVDELQKEMLAQVQKVQAVPDEQFAQNFRAIIGHVKSLSRSVHTGSGSGMFQVLHSGVLLLNTSECHWIVKQNQKYYIEAWIWSVMLEHIFATPFAIFGVASSAFGKSWMWLYGEKFEGARPLPSASCELYRRTVLEEMVRLAGRDTILSGQEDAHILDSERARRLAEGALQWREKVANTIGTQLAIISSTVDFSQISHIVNRSFALALEMSSQRCRLQITYPAIGAAFHSGSMSSIPDLGGKDTHGGDVAFIINPGLTKWGDAHGQYLDQRYDIVPSLVQLQPPKPCASGKDCQERNLT